MVDGKGDNPTNILSMEHSHNNCEKMMPSQKEPGAMALTVPSDPERNTVPLEIHAPILEEQARKARKKGLVCLNCGVKTHAFASLSRVPLTNEFAYKGICMKCDPQRIPPEILKVFQKRLENSLQQSGGNNIAALGAVDRGDREEDSHGSSWEKDSISESKISFEFEGVSMLDDNKSTTLSWSLCSSKEKSKDSDVRSALTRGSWEEFNMASEDPSLWSISYYQLMALYYEAKDHFGDQFPEVTMRDINNEFLVPLCEDFGTSYALHQNQSGLAVDAFVTHCWDGKFGDFVESIRKVFQTHAKKPSLWICAFALNQSNSIKDQVGTDELGIESSPFVVALHSAKHFVVVRNSTTDLYSRIWCVCELIFAKKLGFVPNNTFVTGPDCFSNLQTSCIDAEATNTDDKAKILKVLLDDHDYKEIDCFVNLFRAQDSPL